MVKGFWEREYENIAGEAPESIAASKAAGIFRQANARKVLDAGCGTGQDAAYLAGAGFTAHGIDLSRTAIEKAREKFGKKATFECADITMLRFKEEFDGVYCNKVIQLLKKEEREKAVKKLYDSLKYGGVAAISALSEEDHTFGEGEEVEERTFLVKDGRTRHYFSEQELIRLLASQGFGKINTEKFEEFGRIINPNEKFKFLLAISKKVGL